MGIGQETLTLHPHPAQSLKIKTALETGKSVVPPGMKLDKDRKVLAVTR